MNVQREPISKENEIESNQEATMEVDNSNATGSGTPSSMEKATNFDPDSKSKTKSKKNLVKKFKCEKCNREFSWRKNIERHMKEACKGLKVESSSSVRDPVDITTEENSVGDLKDGHQDDAGKEECKKVRPITGKKHIHPGDHDTVIPEKSTSESDTEQFFLLNSGDVTLEDASKSGQKRKAKFFECPKCGDQLSGRSQLKKHMESTCLYSPKYQEGIWKDSNPLRRKVKKKKAEVENDSIGEAKEKIGIDTNEDIEEYACNLCPKVFKSQYGLKCHIHLHARSSFTCKHCPTKLFDKQEKLDKHIEYHHTKVKCEYPDCNWENFKIDLKKHINRKHLKLYHHECDYCDFKAYGPAKLKVHIGIHTNEKNFKCQWCDYRSNQRSNTRNHEKLYCKYRKKAT